MAALRVVLLMLLLVFLALPQKTLGAQKPLWELGVGRGFLLMPDYRGSDETRAYLLPFPYAIYRGGVFRLEDKRVAARIFKTDRITLDASGYGAVPVRSGNNDARMWMPDLDATFEFGPALRPAAATLEVAAGKDGAVPKLDCKRAVPVLSLIHISEPTRLLSISYAVFCLKKKI